MWEPDLCSSLVFLLASGTATVATCVAMVALAHKHGHIRIWPMPLSFAGSTYPCRMVSRVGFGSAAFFMALSVPRVSDAFIIPLVLCFQEEVVFWLNCWFRFLAWVAALGLFVQGSLAPLEEGTHLRAFAGKPFGNRTHQMHVRGVAAMFVAGFVYYGSATVMILFEFFTCASFEKPCVSLIKFMFPFCLVWITGRFLVHLRATPQVEHEVARLIFFRSLEHSQRAVAEWHVARFRRGGRLQWVSIAAFVGALGALAMEVITFDRVDTCTIDEEFLQASLGFSFVLFVGAVTYGFKRGTRGEVGEGSGDGGGGYCLASPTSFKHDPRRVRSDSVLEPILTFDMDTVWASLAMPEAQENGGAFATQPLLASTLNRSRTV